MRQHLGARRGNYMMTMPFFIPVLVGFAALSIDISYINMSHTQAQHVADAASHAAFIGFRATNNTAVGDAAAQYILDKNKVGNGPAKLSQPIEYGEWDFDGLTLNTGSEYVNAARARVARNSINNNALDLFFAPILGYNTADIATSGVTAGRTRQIMLVQDVSCSFKEEIGDAKAADLAFLEYLDQHPYPRDMMGMVMFGGQAWYPPVYDLSLVDTHYSTMHAEFDKLDYCNDYPSSWAKPRGYNKCGTSQARGLILAREQFDKFGDHREFRAVVILSDGRPTLKLATPDNNGSSFDHTAAAEASAAANQLWGQDTSNQDARTWDGYQVYGCGDDTDATRSNYLDGPGIPYNSSNCKNRSPSTDDEFFRGDVHIWSVFLDTNNDTYTQDWMADNMVKGMGKPYVTSDSDELSQIMVEIASSIPVVLTD